MMCSGGHWVAEGLFQGSDVQDIQHRSKEISARGINLKVSEPNLVVEYGER